MALHDKYRKKYRQADRRGDDSARVRQRIADEAARRLFPQVRREEDLPSESETGPTLDLDRLDPTTLYEAKRKAAAVLGVRVRPGELPADTEVRQRLVELARQPRSAPPLGTNEDEDDEPDVEGLTLDPSEHLDRFQLYRMTLLPLEEVKQDPVRHPEGDALYHALQVFDHARRRMPYDEEFQLAALLHDVGMAIDPRDHVAAGLEALRGAIPKRTAWLIRHHHANLTDSLRRACPDPDWIDDLKLLRECDLAGRVPGVAVDSLDDVLDSLRQLADEDQPEEPER